MPVFEYTVDGVPQTTSEHTLTPLQILTQAQLKPEERYLIQIEGKHQTSYQGKLDDTVHMHQHQTFITAFLGPVPVS